jgi:hypothetical protein
VSSSVDRAIEILCASGFSPLSQPVEIDKIPFQFSAVLVSTESLDLVVLVDTFEGGSEEVVRREVIALGRALDLAGSRRPLTLVLIGQRWSEITERAMSRVARVLRCQVVLGDEARDSALRDALAVLLPLRLPPVPTEPEETWATARAQLEQGLGAADLQGVISAASRGSENVKQALSEYLAVPLEVESDD